MPEETNVKTQNHLYLPLSVLILIVAGCIGSLFIATKANEIAIERLNTHIAQNYITSEQAKEGFDEMKSAIIRMDDRTQEKLTQIDQKIGNLK